MDALGWPASRQVVLVLRTTALGRLVFVMFILGPEIGTFFLGFGWPFLALLVVY